MASQGKCPRCRVRFVFQTNTPYYNRRLRDLLCPRCGGPLKRTSEQSRWPEVLADPQHSQTEG